MIMPKITTKRKNPNWAKDRLKASSEADRYECAVGFPKGKGLGNPHYTTKSAGGQETAGPSILQVAIWNNYGATINHPGGQPFFKDKAGNIIYVSKNNPRAARMKKTKPHKIVIPARPFMELATVAIEKVWKDMQAQIMAKAKRSGKAVDVKGALERAGIMAEGEIKKAIGNGDFAANAPSTIARKKGSTKPLEGDTGSLKQAPTYSVREKGA